MNVQQLIDELNKIEDKTREVHLHVNYGMGCWTQSFDLSVDDFEPEEGEEDVVILSGDEDRNDSGC